MSTRNPFVDNAPIDLVVDPEQPERVARADPEQRIRRHAPPPTIGRRDRRRTRSMVRGAQRPASLSPAPLE